MTPGKPPAESGELGIRVRGTCVDLVGAPVLAARFVR